MENEKIKSQPTAVPKPNFCSECGTGFDGRVPYWSQQKEGRGERWAKRLKNLGMALSGLFSLLFYFFIISFFIGGGGLFSGAQVKPEESLYGKGEEKIALVDISGVIVEDESESSLGVTGSSMTTSRGLIKIFEDVKKDDKVRAVVLRVNSPGGSVTASEEILQLIKRFKAETRLPVIVSQADTAASGGYYISLGGDQIVADATTLTGSIGAIMESVNFKELADKIGVKGVIIASGENKDLLNPFEEVQDEDREILQKIVNEARNQFVSRIIEARKIDQAKLEKIADGRVLSGKQALEEGLIDRLGNFNDAVELAKEKAGLKEAMVVEFGKKGFLESLLGVVSSRLSLVSSSPFNYLQAFNAQPAYLYIP